MPEPDGATNESCRLTLVRAFLSTVDGLVVDRRAEGAEPLDTLSALLDEIAALRETPIRETASRPATKRARLASALAELLEGERWVPEDRLAAEVAILARRCDVHEELDRLSAHVEAARSLLREDVPVARRLEFLAQEFSWEANMLGAKSALLALTRRSLDGKAMVERLREQAANVE